jgi:hypothetical protein
MTDLSPAAQDIVNAAVESGGGYGRATPTLHARLAAALRVVADQVVPEQLEPPCGETEPWPQGYQLMRDAQWEKCQQLRSEILAIAAELRGQDQPSSEEL